MKYKTIIMDPPWNETGGGKIKRGADRHYSLFNLNFTFIAHFNLQIILILYSNQTIPHLLQSFSTLGANMIWKCSFVNLIG